jgi:hypothetical protein
MTPPTMITRTITVSSHSDEKLLSGVQTPGWLDIESQGHKDTEQGTIELL